MRVRSAWNEERDICILRFEYPVATIGQMPFNAVNYALETFYNQSDVTDPYCMTLWSGDKQWGILVAETMNLDDQQAFVLADSIVEAYDRAGDHPSPYDPHEWSF